MNFVQLAYLILLTTLLSCQSAPSDAETAETEQITAGIEQQTSPEEKPAAGKMVLIGYFEGKQTDEYGTDVLYKLKLWKDGEQIVGKAYNSVFTSPMSSDDYSSDIKGSVTDTHLKFKGNFDEDFTFSGTYTDGSVIGSFSYPTNASRNAENVKMEKCCTEEEGHQSFDSAAKLTDFWKE